MKKGTTPNTVDLNSKSARFFNMGVYAILRNKGKIPQQQPRKSMGFK